MYITTTVLTLLNMESLLSYLVYALGSLLL